MKHMKKLASFVLALILVFAMATTASAANDGSITVTNPVVGETYDIYLMFDLESFSGTSYSYKINSDSKWYNFVTGTGAGTEYVNVDAQGYVTWIKKDAQGNDIGAADFAEAALTYATANSISATATSGAIADGTTSYEFSGLALGYYLVDSSLGALCGLTTTDKTAEVTEKNEEPTITKVVEEDSDNGWGSSNTAQIGQTVNFKTTVSAKPGATNYVVHDKMSDGLTLDVDSIAVTGLTKGTDYTVKIADALDTGSAYDTPACSDCDFEIVFAQTYLDTITDNTDIVITYSAVLNDKALISTDANTNDAKLIYGANSETEWAHTDTYTFEFDIIKTKADLEVLDGATFELYDALTEDNKIPLVKDGDVYRVATAEEIAASGFTSAIISAGTATVVGLDANTTYYLEEVAAPEGYNKLSARVPVAIENANLTTTMTDTDTTWSEGNGGVQITNNTGTELPSTGGIGTTIFYIVGAVLVLAAVVLLVTKKRMNREG